MNKFLSVRPLDPREAPTVEHVGSLSLAKGLVRSDSPRVIDLGMTALMANIRFERNGIRKDFGDRGLGGNAPNFVLCLVEHKFIDAEGDKYQRLIRLMRHTDGRAKTEIWNETTEEWEEDAIATSQLIEDRFVRAISVRGVLLFACKGSGILERTEAIIYSNEFDDFPAGNSLTVPGDETSLTLTPSGRVKGGDFIVYYDVDLDLISGTNLAVSVGLYVNNVIIAAKQYVQAAVGSTSWPGETFTFSDPDLGDGDVVKLRFAGVSIDGGTPETASFISPGGTPKIQATKTQAAEAFNDMYTLKYQVAAGAGGIDVDLYYDDGGGWTQYGPTLSYPPYFNDFVEEIMYLDGMGANSKFGIDPDEPLLASIIADEVEWETSAAGYTVAIHGYNLPTDADANHGIEYEAQTGKTVTLEPIADAPEATWIESFGDRIIALQDGGDTQKLSASADGTHDDWTGGDSVETLLVDTRNDPVDDLQCAGPLASNVLAVIRSRSIMKSFETGNFDLAIGTVHWIESVGTESPHSISITPAGLAFLGHDYMVYLLTEGGLIAVGEQILQDLIETLTGNLHRVDGIYDPIYQEYWLGIPEDGSNYITATYIFDVGGFLASGGQVRRWRKRVQNVQRYAVVSSAV